MTSCVLLGSATFGSLASGETSHEKAVDPKCLIESIDRSVVFDGRNGKACWAWFHPRACMVPTPQGPLALMTMQTASGSDYFGPVHFTTSTNMGKTWTTPEPITGMGRHPLQDNHLVGVCDVVPEYHVKTNTALAIGHNVHYKDARLAQPQDPRWPVYTVRDSSGQWSKPQKLEWDDLRGSVIYTCGCAQRTVLPNGDLLIPLYFRSKGTHYMVTSVRASFDGKKITITNVGNTLVSKDGRGLTEPSLTLLDGRHYMTIRAEDGRGYMSTSADGLQWEPIRPWTWDDGTPLTMSTTQQHWLTHSDGLFLVYTRKAQNNTNVMRWRAPIFMARVDLKTLRLKRDTEKVVLPLIGDGIRDAKHVARMGNFHITNASPKESWITVGECLPNDKWRGDLLLARVRWSKNNQLVKF